MPLEDVSSEILEHAVYEISPELLIPISIADDDETIPDKEHIPGDTEGDLHPRGKKKETSSS